MAGNLKKKSGDKDDRVEVHVEEFIPYACHYDSHTLLTKNGELLQVIKISSAENKSKNDLIRDNIQKAIKENIKTGEFSFWFHNIRRKKPASDNRETFVNNLYISILIQGEEVSLANLKTLFRNFSFKKEVEHKNQYFVESVEKLNITTASIVNSLQEYDTKKLGIRKEDDVYYSEILSFLGKIINLKEHAMPLLPVDVSEILTSNKVSFGFNSLEVNIQEKSYSGAILTLKEYHDIPSKHIDRFMQISQQFILTETFNFIDKKTFQKKAGAYINFAKMSGNKETNKASGIDAFLDDKKEETLGEHQISILVLEESPELLEEGVNKIIRALSNLGISVIREDIFMEDCYWAGLPGNFEFIKRTSPININNIASYASLGESSSGYDSDTGEISHEL